MGSITVVTFKIHTIDGKLIKLLTDIDIKDGLNIIKVDISQFALGTYTLTVESSTFNLEKRFIVN